MSEIGEEGGGRTIDHTNMEKEGRNEGEGRKQGDARKEGRKEGRSDGTEVRR